MQMKDKRPQKVQTIIVQCMMWIFDILITLITGMVLYFGFNHLSFWAALVCLTSGMILTWMGVLSMGSVRAMDRNECEKELLATIWNLIKPFGWYFVFGGVTVLLSWYMDLSNSGKLPDWIGQVLWFFLFLMLLISSLMDMNAANFGRMVGFSLICVSFLLVSLDVVLSTSPTWLTYVGVFSFLAGLLLSLCDIPKIGGKTDKICAYFTLMYWKNVLVKNRISIDGVELDAESGGWDNPGKWDPEARMFLMDQVSKRRVPLSGVAAILTALVGIWEPSQTVVKKMFSGDSKTFVIIFVLLILAIIVAQSVRSYYWRWLESMKRKIELESDEKQSK
ncbi:hypothetical protein [Bifidobacterium dentium]|uniref:hypothetical protein n=1 Tax=Bifidobacterium dentium TaxID=1689 RepID=UPI0018B0DC40|nr:hypothetical protein [Bifidobacterium dentium]MBF9690094.1 hypothetical protein [Bifidobacterium dentium]